MKRIITIAIPIALALSVSAPVSPVWAQGMSGNMGAGRVTGPGYEVTAEMQRFREATSLMRDMSQQMNKLQESMAKGAMTLQQQKQMRQQLKEMADMMKGMVWLADRPSMNDPETKKQTEEMRKQMDGMMRTQP